MNKREQLAHMRKEHARDRAETRDNEMYTREGEDFTIQMIRDKMARVLHDPEIDAEHRKERLAELKEEIEVILDQRDEREHDFIEQELQRHQLEQELEQEIREEEQEKKPKKTETDEYREKLSQLLYARTSLKVGAEATRKAIQENSRALSEAEQFSTILINNSERDAIPAFTSNASRRKIKEAPPPEQIARIDTLVAKQREIGMLYKESAQLQESQLQKPPKREVPPTPEPEEPEIDTMNEGSDEDDSTE